MSISGTDLIPSYFLGNEGESIDIDSLLNSTMLDDRIIQVYVRNNSLRFLGEDDTRLKRSQLLVHHSFTPSIVLADSPDTLTRKVKEVYELHIANNKPCAGVYGDIIKLKPLGNELFLIYEIGQRHYDLKKEAADFCAVMKHKDQSGKDRYQMLLVTRKNPPEGLAFPGGFCNVKGKVCDAPAYTAIKEFMEEANSKGKWGVKPEAVELEAYREDYDFESTNLKMTYANGTPLNATFQKLGTIPTSNKNFGEGGELLPDGSKRVHTTTGFSCFMDFSNDESIDAEALSSMFHAGDDAAAVKLVDITDSMASSSNESPLQFAFAHHAQLFKLMLSKARGHFNN